MNLNTRTRVRVIRKPYAPPPQTVKPRPPVDVEPPELAGQLLERTAGRT